MDVRCGNSSFGFAGDDLFGKSSLVGLARSSFDRPHPGKKIVTRLMYEAQRLVSLFVALLNQSLPLQRSCSPNVLAEEEMQGKSSLVRLSREGEGRGKQLRTCSIRQLKGGRLG